MTVQTVPELASLRDPAAVGGISGELLPAAHEGGAGEVGGRCRTWASRLFGGIGHIKV